MILRNLKYKQVFDRPFYTQVNVYQFHFIGSLKRYKSHIVILPGWLRDLNLNIQGRITEGFQ